MFKVWSIRPRYFSTLEAAIEYANNYCKKTGNIVAITEYKQRKRVQK